MTTELDPAPLDAADELAAFRDEFVTDEVIYLDGNSLGRLPRSTPSLIASTVTEEWGEGLVGSWRRWLDLPRQVGDRLAPIVGAVAGEVLITDQTTLNLYKLAHAGLADSGRRDILSSASNFPSDLYVLASVAESLGGRLRLLPAGRETARAVSEAAGPDVGLVALSHVDYRTGALADLVGITAAAHDGGALALWDLSHSAGVVPVELRGAGADFAVGCTYKYLNGGPGAPAFLYVRSELHETLEQPIPGWFGHDDQFGFEPAYRPAAGIARFAVGTPPILSLRGTEAGVAITARAGVASIRRKSVGLTAYLIELFDTRLAPLGFTLETPRRPADRGGHVAISHRAAWQITQALIDRDVVPDFRHPDVIRLGPAPLYTRYRDIRRAVSIIEDVVDTGAYQSYPEERTTVT